MIDWNKVLGEAVSAAETIIGAQWKTISRMATVQIEALVKNAQDIERLKDEMTELEFRSVVAGQKLALQMILCTSAAISIVTAEQVAAAVWDIVAAALGTIPELAPFV